MSKWKWIVAGRRAVLAVCRLLRRDVGSWRPAVRKNCRRQIPLPAPSKGRKMSLLDNLQICRGEFANYLTKRVLSPSGGTNFGPLCDGFGGSSLSSGKLVPSAGLTQRKISTGGGGRRWPRPILLGCPDRLPDLEGRRRHCDVAHAERGQCVEDGADDDGECRRAAAFAAGL